MVKEKNKIGGKKFTDYVFSCKHFGFIRETVQLQRTQGNAKHL